jgi:hypothetical protein
MMPKIPTKRQERKIHEEARRMTLREFADEMSSIADAALEVRRRVLGLQAMLYTRGFDDRGPITENKDDVPF